MNFKLKDLSIGNKGQYGIGASSCEFNADYPQYLRITDIDDYGYAPKQLATSINPFEYQDWNKYLLKKNDIVFARTGNSTGRNHFIKEITNPTVFAGFLIKFSLNQNLVLPNYVGYYCQSQHYWNQIRSLFTGSTRANVNAEQYGELKIPFPKYSVQQHIVNTIGSVDDLIENYEQKIKKLFNIGLTKIEIINQTNELISFLEIAKLEKGIEIGSSNYLDTKNENNIHYLRVGDLESIQNTYIEKNVARNQAYEDDILIAFDGAPGRNNIGLSGSFSSGIYKIVSDNSLKGLLYFEINSKLNQTIINDHSQGTTILHAAKSIPYLVAANCNLKDKESLNYIFNELVCLKKKIIYLKQVKNLLLNKYFTNRQ